MITLPTGEFVGLIGDVLPFAHTDKDYTRDTCIHLMWDGEMLHAEATDRISYGRAFWSPEDPPDTDVEQESLFAQWGSADKPWDVVLELADAKDIVKNFKLGAKEWGVVLEVTFEDGRLCVERQRDERHSALRQDIDGRVIDTDEMKFPDMEAAIAKRDAFMTGQDRATAAIAFAPKRLAAFGKVRERGPVEFELWGQTGSAKVKIGGRFVGAIHPARVEAPVA